MSATAGGSQKKRVADALDWAQQGQEQEASHKILSLALSFSLFFLLFFSSSSPPNKLDVQLLQQSELQETYRNTIVGNQDFGDDRGASKALHKNGTSSCGTRAKDRAGLGCGTAPKVREADVSYASTSDSG